MGFTHMLFSTDKRWNAKKFPDSAGLDAEAEKQVIFVRYVLHSAWLCVRRPTVNYEALQ